jgi:hypothetical protein
MTGHVPEFGGHAAETVGHDGPKYAISRRYQHKSTVVTTNKPFAEWGEVFPNAACVVSLIDRLMHRAEVVRIEGKSYRQKEADEREAARKTERAARKTAPRSSKAAP